MMKHVTIYTDGACSGNPGPGGWAAILLYKNHKKEISGGEGDTTNNRMEIFAAIAGMEALTEACKVTIYTDSAYLCNAFNENWIEKWQINGWQSTKKQPVENQDLWERILLQTNKHQVDWIKVKGHSDNAFNNRCDQLARNAIRALETKNASLNDKETP
ncbi:ribonuclease HI [Christensenellaceae bacterium OttesenSCG-928-L17]|nr:ribonuclease HI [Christensenellaceae bacterium OttesenSCG-928-L17]